MAEESGPSVFTELLALRERLDDVQRQLHHTLDMAASEQERARSEGPVAARVWDALEDQVARARRPREDGRVDLDIGLEVDPRLILVSIGGMDAIDSLTLARLVLSLDEYWRDSRRPGGGSGVGSLDIVSIGRGSIRIALRTKLNEYAGIGSFVLALAAFAHAADRPDPAPPPPAVICIESIIRESGGTVTIAGGSHACVFTPVDRIPPSRDQLPPGYSRERAVIEPIERHPDDDRLALFESLGPHQPVRLIDRRPLPLEELRAGRRYRLQGRFVDGGDGRRDFEVLEAIAEDDR